MALRMFEGRPLAAKILVIGLIVLGLMIPLSMLRGLIVERSQMRTQAVDTVAKGWGGSLTVGGPMLRVPFDIERKSKSGEVSMESHQLYILADELNIQASLEHMMSRRIGIYGVPVYLMRIKMRGTFKIADVLAAAATGPYPSAIYHWKDASLRLPISDVRGIRKFIGAMVGEYPLAFGPALAEGFPGIKSKIDLSQFFQEASLPFSGEMMLAGSQSVAFLPTAVTTQASLQAPWPDPQYQGAFLPSQYAVDAHGFNAQWQVLALNRSFAQSWIDGQVDTNRMAGTAYGVNLFQSVDVYQRSERAVKYALLFIALTFLSFFAWESLGRLPIHTMHYLFIGLALSTFYLLLIALSEHLPFWMSFWLGAAALVALLGFYVSGAMDSSRLGVIISAVMSLVYGLLYMLVLSENYA
ncbi:MAG TPA: cell envelope integrity protein CreD, partial [Steroidobacteraceae bacterium]